jgi:hypothetical protein
MIGSSLFDFGDQLDIILDVEIRNNVLLPIMFVMVLFLSLVSVTLIFSFAWPSYGRM